MFPFTEPLRPLRALVATALVAAALLAPAGGPGARAAPPRAAKPRATAPAVPAPPAPRADDRATVTVLFTCDLHGHVLPEEDFSGAPAPRGLARVATLVAHERGRDPQALLVDAGDATSGSPLEIAYHERAADVPGPTIAAMNLLRYDAMVLGNHEFDFGPAAQAGARRRSSFPWLAANVTVDAPPESAEAAFAPYRVLKAHGVRVGILGLTTSALPALVDSAARPHVRVTDALAAARQWVPVLRRRERCDAVIVLAHFGLERDPAGGGDLPDQLPDENQAFALASQVPGVDAAILGHTHRALPSATLNGVLLSQAGKWGESLGRLELRLTRTGPGGTWQVSSKSATLLAAADVPPDSAMLALAAPYRAAAQAWLDQPVGRCERRIPADGGLVDGPLGDLVHAAQLRYGNADVSLAPLPGAGPGIAAGTVRMRDLAPLAPYENQLVTLEVTGAQLRAALEHAAAGFDTYDFGRSDRAAPSAPPHFDTAAGVDYVVDLTRPPGQRVTGLRYLGRPLDDARLLHLAVDSYRAAGGAGYAMLAGAKVLRRSERGTVVRDLLARYVRETGPLRPATDDNWRITPACALAPARDAFERLARRGVWTAAQASALDPAAPLTRVQFASWLATAYGAAPGATDGGGAADTAATPAPDTAAQRPVRTRFLDVPPEWSAAVARAAAIGVFAGLRGNLLRPLEPLDLLTATDWIAHAATRGTVPRPRPAAPPPDVAAHAAAARAQPPAPVPAALRPAAAPPGYGRARLPLEVERYAADRGFLDEWDPAADPAHLTVADGARLLASARYPVVTILWTTDFHGALELRERERDTNRLLGGTAGLAAYLERERAQNPSGTLLMDGGDLFQGTMLSNLFFGRPVIEQMNRLGYDAAAVGNHDFDWSVDTLRARMREARFPFLSANIYRKADGKRPEWVRPDTVFERRGLEIAVLGFSTVETPTVTLPQNVAALEFRPEADIARQLLPRLREGGADVVIVMGHLPVSQDSTRHGLRDELADLGRAIHGEDALFGGHSHTFVNGRLGDVPVINAGSQGRAIGRVDLTVDRLAHRVVERHARLVHTYADAITPDPRYAAFVDSLTRALAAVAGRDLCTAPRALTRNRRAESTLGDWVADVMRERARADVAITNPGGLRADIDAGPVTMQDVFEVMPFDNRIVTVRLTGSQLLDAVEHGLSGGSCPVVSGIRVVFDASRPAGERVVRLTLADGRPLDLEASYRVAVNDFMAQGGDGYTVLAKGKDLEITGDLIRDALVADCVARGQRGAGLDVALDGRMLATATPPPVDTEPQPVPVGAPKR